MVLTNPLVRIWSTVLSIHPVVVDDPDATSSVGSASGSPSEESSDEPPEDDFFTRNL